MPLKPSDKRKLKKRLHLKERLRSAQMTYFIACIFFLVGIADFILGYMTVGAIFAAVGVIELLFAIALDIREEKKKRKESPKAPNK